MLPLTFEVEEVESEAEEESFKTSQSQISPSYSDLKSDVLNILHEKMFKKKYVKLYKKCTNVSNNAQEWTDASYGPLREKAAKLRRRRHAREIKNRYAN